MRLAHVQRELVSREPAEVVVRVAHRGLRGLDLGELSMASDLPSDTNPSVTTDPVAFFGVPSGDVAARPSALTVVTVATSAVPTSSADTP